MLISIWICLLPLITWGGRYEVPKVTYFLVRGFLLTLYLLIKINKREIIFKFNKIDIFYFLWLITLIISSFFGVHFGESIIGGSYRFQGVLFFFTLWLTYKTLSLFNKKQKKFLYKAIAISILIESIIVISQTLTNNLYFGKPLGTIGEANAIAGFIAIGAYFVIESLPTLASVTLFAALLITQSRSGILAYLVNIKLPKFLSIFIVSFALLLVGIFSFEKNILPASPFENRTLIWQLGINKIIERPILGYGAESNEVIYDKAFKEIHLPLSNLIIDRAHNLILDVTLWSGCIGLTFFGGFLYQSFIAIKDRNRKLSFIAFLIYAFFQPLSIVHWILFFTVIS